MAALGKIRSKGALLIGIIGLGLFSFIAEEAFRSCDSASADKHQQVGEVLGEKINVTEFQKLVDEYTEVLKMQQGQENLNEDQLNQVKDMVWNTYVQTKIIENEAHKLGLTVTDALCFSRLRSSTSRQVVSTLTLLRSSSPSTRHSRQPTRRWLSSTIQFTSTGHS